MPKRYLIVLEEEDELDELEDDRDRDPNYNPFVDEDALFRDPRKTHKQSTQSPKKKEESVASTFLENY